MTRQSITFAKRWMAGSSSAMTIRDERTSVIGNATADRKRAALRGTGSLVRAPESITPVAYGLALNHKVKGFSNHVNGFRKHFNGATEPRRLLRLLPGLEAFHFPFALMHAAGFALHPG